ncbi:MAG TPA: hypothetical protein VFB35_10240 [Gaiellaceae bacterium]|nr:hypothetical protein [Gaiellaceae bacterium]
MYPQRNRRKRAAWYGALLALLLGAAGCGGGGAATTQTEPAGKAVNGAGFTFRAPPDWTTVVGPTGSSARHDPSTLVSVAVLPLVKLYRLALFPKVVKELDRVADTYAANLKGRVTSRRTVEVAGRQAREYRVAHGDLVDAVTFVLRGKRNFQLTCRWRDSDGEPAACAQLAASFAFR